MNLKSRPVIRKLTVSSMLCVLKYLKSTDSPFIPPIAAVRKYLTDRLYRVQSTGKRLDGDYGASYYDIIYSNKINVLAKKTPVVSDLVKNHPKDHR